MKPWERYGSGGTPPGGGGPWSQYGGPADAEPAPAGRGVGGTLKDLGVGVVQGAVNLAGGLAELPNLATGGALDQNVVRPAQRALDRALGGPGADNGGISGGIARINEGLDAAASPTLKGRRQELAEAMDRGPLAGAGKVVTDPVLMGQFLAEQVPIIATLGAGSVGTAGRAAAAARAGGAGTKAAQEVGRAAVQRNLIGANVAMGAGFSGQEAQQRVAALPDEAWQANPEYVALAEQVGPDEAKRRLGVEAGQIAAAVAGPISGAVSRLTAPFEAQVFTRGLNTGLPAAVGKEAAEEAVQEGGEAFAANLGVQQRADPSQALGEGVLESAAVGGAVGGVLGGGLYGAGRLTRLNEDVQPATPSIAGALPSPTIVPDAGDPAAAFEAQRKSMENAERSQQLYAERDAEVARREAAMQTLAANGIDPNAGPISKGVARLALTRAPIEAAAGVDPARTFEGDARTLDAVARAEQLYQERAAEETRRAAAMAGNLPAQILDPKTNGPFRSMPGLNAQRKKLGANADRYEVQKLGPRQWVLALKDDPNANPTDPSAPTESPVAAGAANQETWQAFAPETTLNVPRDVMPQVKSEHRGALVNFLKGRGVTAEPSQAVDPLTLQPSQMEFSPEKVARAKTFAGIDRAILVSADNRVIDGHHQWLAKVDAGEPVSVIRINAPAEEVLPLVSEFPSSTVEQRSPKGLQDDRLSDEGLVVDLRAMAPEAGWAEIGGSIIRAGADGEVTGRTKWLPNAPWFPVVQRDARLPGNQAGRATQEAVRKAIAGEPMSAAERRHVEAMLDWAETEREDLTARGFPDADPFELAGALADADSDMPPRIVAMMDAVAQQDEAEAERLAIQYDDDAALEAALQEWLDGRRTQEADTRAASAEGGADLPWPDGSQEGPAEPGEEVAPPEVREPEADFTLTPPPGPGGDRRTGGPASQAQADLFGDRNETQQALADRNRQRDAMRSGTDDVPAGMDGGLFSNADRQRDLVDAATATPENETDGEATNLPTAGQGAAGADTPAPAVDRDGAASVSLGYGFSDEGAPAGAEYASQADLVEFRRQRLGVDRVRSSQDAARALAYLADGGVERLDAVVTDAEGKPLAVVGGYKGNINSASVHPEVLLSEAIGIAGAARIWIAHNHPSGNPDLSSADRRLAGRIEATFKDSGIEVGGLLAIGSGASGRRRYQGVTDGGITQGDIPVSAAEADGPEVSVLERRLQRTDKLGPTLSDPASASVAAMKLSGGRPGFILLDSQHAPIAFVPVAPDVAGELRRDGRLAALYRAVARSPAAAAIVVNPDNKYARQVADNLGGALQSGGLNIRVLDRIDLDTPTGKGVSVAARGWEAASSTFYRADANRRLAAPTTVADIRSELDAAFGRAGVKRLIDDGILQIVASRQDLPADTLETMRRHFPGRTMGIYVPSTETAYIIGDEIEAGEAPRILLHEIGEHYGLERMLGTKAYGRLQSEVRALKRRGNPLVSTAWDQVARNYPHLEPGGETFVREVIAHVGEQADGLRMPFMRRVIQAVRRFLFSIGFHVKLRDAEIVGMVQASLRRTMSTGRGAGVDRSRQPLAAQAGRMGSQRSPSAGFPPIHRMARLGAMRDHADYAAAKAGDPEAAARVVADTLTVPGVQALRRALDGKRPRVVPVMAAEAGGRNALPRAYALALGELLGLEVETDIVQTVRAFHTNANAYQRIASQPVFDGRVEPGADYLIVDDTQAMGGTLANLRGHIEAAGGRVVLASALTGHETTADIALRPDMRESLIAKHGQALDDYLNETFGFGIDALTQGEAGHLRAAPSLDVIRDRLTEARSSLGLTEDSGSPESEPPLLRLGETAEQREALRKAGLGLATKTQGERFTAGLSDRWNAFAEGALKRAEEGIFNRFAPIRDAERAQGKRDAQDSAYVAARLSTGTSSTVTALLLFGHGEWRNGVIQKKAGTRGLLDLLEPVRGNLDAWSAWMVAKRAEYLRRQDRENNLTDADIAALKAVATDAGFDEETLEKVARDVRDFNTSVLRLAEGAGLLTAEQVKAYARDRYYIPFFREDEEGDPMRPFLRRGLSHQAAGIKALKGGRQALTDPLANMLGNVSRLVDAALKNNAAAKAVTNLPQHFEELGKDADKSRAVRVMLGGEPRYFRALDPALMRAMAGFAPDRWPDGLAPFRTAKRLLTAGVTADPAFIIRNFIRDVLYSWAVSKDRFTPLVDSIKGVRSSLRQDEDTQAVMFAGASFLGGSQFGGDFDSAADSLRRAMSRKGFPKTAGETLAIGPRFWQMYRELGEAVENANRSAIFKAVNARGGTAAEAIFESKDLMDYSLSGSWTAVRLLADVVPFFNARLQGLYKLGRSLDQRQLYYAGTAIMAASLALLLVNHDDERWQALTNEDKDLFWHVFIGEIHYRIPKPFEIGVMFGTVPERLAMQMLGQDARLGERAIWTLVETFALDPTPQFVKPMMEASFNYDTFRNAPIEGMADEGKLPEARFDTRTSETMVAIGQATGTSPKKLEHLWNAYLGSLGGYALDAVDALVSWGSPGEKADMTLRDVPVLGAFARSSQPAATRYSREMYELLREAEQVYRTVREYQRQGEIEAAEKLIADNKALLAVRPALNQVSRRMRDIRANMDNIRRDTGMSGAEKRRRLDQLETMLYAASRRAVTLAEEQGA